MTKTQHAVGLTLLALGGVLMAAVLLGLGIIELEPNNPFEKDDVCFARSTPGATSRFIQYTPIACKDASIKIGEEIGADYAKLRFEDVDKDGIPEAIVESSSFRCRYGAGPCYDAYRIVMKICTTCAPKARILETTYLKNLTQSP